LRQLMIVIRNRIDLRHDASPTFSDRCLSNARLHNAS
jgi:hypothetical protein